MRHLRALASSVHMRIGIITIQKCDNFGADLQAYALGAKLRSLGYEAENIDYLFYKHPRHVGGTGEKPIFRLPPVTWVKERLFPTVSAVRNLRRRETVRARSARFSAWAEAHLKCGGEYRSVASLYANPPRYDVYMVGSDQVWNPRMGSSLLPYFLDFAPDDARCVSYAASFGVSELPANVFYTFKRLLRRFSAIGMREKVGADIVSAMALGVEVCHVLDPTLLLDAGEWRDVASRPADMPDGPFLLLYDLVASEETNALARRWAFARGLPVVRMGDGAYGPGEFVWLFAHAECVVTNSFHGTAFAINNGKPFFSVVPRGMRNASRIESLLQVLGLTDRLVAAADCGRVGLDGDIDVNAVSLKLDEARTGSLAFLCRAIEGPTVRVEHKLPRGCYAVWNADDRVRAASTSGGIFRVLAEHVIGQGGVVYGAAFSEDFRHVRHQAAESLAALDPLMKSKYVWSDPTKAYKQAVENLKAGRTVLFTGTPCQVAAIKSLARDCSERLWTMDLVCHGTPRSEIFASYVEELAARFGGKVMRYEFRNKDAGWNFPRVSAEFATKGVKFRSDAYFLGFGLNVTLRPGCFTCPYANLERVADFTLADCWRVATSHPEWDDGKGTSLVLVNSAAAAVIWEELLASGKVKGGAYDLDLAQMRNMPLMQRARKPAMYERFQKIFDETGSFAEAARCFLTRKLVLRATLVYWIKRLGWFYFRRHQ